MKASRRSGCTAVNSAQSTIAQALEMHFHLPYRASYGQSLSIVGSTKDLGSWDLATRVPMEWSDGDVWRAKVLAEYGDMEYKYVVVDSDGQVHRWKDGGNFELALNGFCGTVHIEDAWDGSVHDIQTSAAELPAAETPSTSVDDAASPAEPARESPLDSHDEALQAALRQAFGDLQEALDAGKRLASGVEPDDPRLLVNDQRLAAVQERAVSLSKAIQAGAPPPAYILKEIQERRVSESDSDSDQTDGSAQRS